MALLFPHPHRSPDRWLRRLDRAAGAMNPVLTVLAIGLAVLNLTCLALLASRLPIAHGMPGLSACLPSSAGSPGAAPPARGDQGAWTLY
jgi:hypothetical protein